VGETFVAIINYSFFFL